jgi:hypothetical protein
MYDIDRRQVVGFISLPNTNHMLVTSAGRLYSSGASSSAPLGFLNAGIVNSPAGLDGYLYSKDNMSRNTDGSLNLATGTYIAFTINFGGIFTNFPGKAIKPIGFYVHCRDLYPTSTYTNKSTFTWLDSLLNSSTSFSVDTYKGLKSIFCPGVYKNSSFKMDFTSDSNLYQFSPINKIIIEGIVLSGKFS